MSETEGTVQIARRGVDRLKAGHLWIYKSDVERLRSEEHTSELQSH